MFAAKCLVCILENNVVHYIFKTNSCTIINVPSKRFVLAIGSKTFKTKDLELYICRDLII